MYGFRYHLVTVIAVFMALGIGILLGGSIGQDLFVNEQIELVSRLEEKYTATRAENNRWSQRVNDLAKQTEQLDQLIRQMGDVLVQGKLTGKSVVLLQLDQGNLTDLTGFLQRAGATVQSVVSIKDPDYLTAHSMLVTLAKNLAEPDASVMWLPFAQSQLELQGTVRSRPDVVVLIGNVPRNTLSKVQAFETGLVKELHKHNVRVIGAERTDTDDSVIPAYRMLKVPTVDNVDQAAGMLALVGLIQGKNGHFGIKQTAEMLLPSFDSISVGSAVEVQSR